MAGYERDDEEDDGYETDFNDEDFDDDDDDDGDFSIEDRFNHYNDTEED